MVAILGLTILLATYIGASIIWYRRGNRLATSRLPYVTNPVHRHFWRTVRTQLREGLSDSVIWLMALHYLALIMFLVLYLRTKFVTGWPT